MFEFFYLDKKELVCVEGALIGVIAGKNSFFNKWLRLEKVEVRGFLRCQIINNKILSAPLRHVWFDSLVLNLRSEII